jgi:hypothetical protein
MLRALILVAVVSTPVVAAAQGYCLSEEKRGYEADRLDAHAKNTGEDELSGAILWCVTVGSHEADAKGTAAFRKRATNACTVIAARKPESSNGIVEACTDFLVENGTKKVGAVDLVARIFARPTKWEDQPTLRAIATTKDARARTTIVDATRLALKAMAGKKLDDISDTASWTSFRVDALAALELVGTKADLALVDEIAASVKGYATITGQKDGDFVHPAVRKARAAIAKR